MSPPPAASALDPHGRISFPWVPCLAGMSSGVITNTILQPLDVAKTSLINPHNHSTTLRSFFTQLHATTGIAGFWRGVDAAILRISLGSGMYFTTQTYLLEYAHQQQRRNTPHSLRDSFNTTTLPSSVALGVGFVSRGLAVAFCCPISVVKTRIEGAPTHVSPYRNVFHGLITVAKNEGVRGLYAGVVPSVIKDAPYGALYLLLYTRFKSLLIFTSHSLSLPLSRDSITVQMFAGLGAGGLATLMVHPTEVIKTRMQLVSATSTANTSGSRLLAITRSIYHDSGIRGFFRGSLPRCTKRAASNAISWMLFEQLVAFWHGATHL